MESSVSSKIQRLDDLGLAILLSLVAEQHCLITGDAEIQQYLSQELRLICQTSFRLQPAIIDCTEKTTVDEFNDAVLVEREDTFEPVGDQSENSLDDALKEDRATYRRTASRFSNGLDERRIADVVIARNLDLVGQNVQVQVLELLRTGRIFSRSSMHTWPRNGLFIAILSRVDTRLFKHLNDMFALSHHHAVDDGLPHLDGHRDGPPLAWFSKRELQDLRILAGNARMTGEVAEYLHNIVVFMRLNRYVKSGVTAAATRHLRSLASALAPIHGIDYVTPSLVALAARKVYNHRLILTTLETERSMQWGSNPAAVEKALRGVTVEDAVEDVLATVETPL